MIDRRLSPLLEPVEYPPPEKASELSLRGCQPADARDFIAAWHSRLPLTQSGPWMCAFIAHYRETCFAAALWNNPSARTLPSDWLELRRFAVAPDAPHCTASWMLAAMTRRLRRQTTRFISYQDTDVHTGTIYRAAGWSIGAVAKPRQRDRSKPRVGTQRAYRSNLNGASPDAAGKIRWELDADA
jgi:hypothetical protein